jgi:NAD(P)-dependent dehydrogenase (short-subunit alcohol dehydrogenase family)
MSSPLRLSDRTAVITGAAGGIGRAIAMSLGRRGAHLVLADVNESGLAETVRLIGESNQRVSAHHLDVGKREAVAAFPKEVLEHHPGVDILVNNAGVALGGTFEQVSEADFEWLFDINFWGVVRMTRAFLPLLHASGDGHLVNISSLFGLIAPPGQAAYSAAKFAVRGFSQSLRLELEGSNVGVTVVHPGGIATSIARNARGPAAASKAQMEKNLKDFDKMLRMPPEEAGEIIVKAVEKRKPRVIVGSDAKMASIIERFAPVAYGRFIQHLKPRQ